MSSQNTILTNVLDKLDQMPVKFDITDTDIAPAYNDALREMGIGDIGDVTNLTTEFYIELRTEYWMLHRLKNSQSLNFKYSTSVDGRSVDKTDIPKVIQKTMDDLDLKFNTWKTSTYNRSSGTWDMTQRTKSRLTTTS
jgi:hypothetical protein